MDLSGRKPIASAPRDGTQILLWCAGTNCDQPGFKLGYFIKLGTMLHLMVNGVPYAVFAGRFPFWWELPDQPDREHHAAPAAAMRDMFT